jgi:hypothetical protein
VVEIQMGDRVLRLLRQSLSRRLRPERWANSLKQFRRHYESLSVKSGALVKLVRNVWLPVVPLGLLVEA